MIFFMTFSKLVVIPKRTSAAPRRQGFGNRRLVLRALTGMLPPFRCLRSAALAEQDNSYTLA